MKILFLCRLFYPHIGGVERHVFEISKRLIDKGNEITIITESHEPGLRKKEVFEKIHVYRMPYFEESRLKKFKIWKWVWKNRSLFKHADIIHCHDVFFWYLPLRILYLTRKIFITFHGYESYPISKKAKLIRRISNFLSSGNITIGKFIEKWYGTRADYISYGAVVLPKKKTGTIKKPSALFIGRLDEQTNILEYAKSASFLKKKIPTFSLTVMGSGKYRQDIKENTRLLGWRKKPEKNLSKFRFAFVSRYLSILEAFAARRLVFALYDNPIKKDYLKLTPFKDQMVICYSPEDLSKKVIHYFKHPDKEKKLIDKAYKWVSSQTWEKVVEMYLSLWKR